MKRELEEAEESRTNQMVARSRGMRGAGSADNGGASCSFSDEGIARPAVKRQVQNIQRGNDSRVIWTSR